MTLSFIEALTERFNRAGGKSRAEGDTALHQAARSGHLRDVKRLLRGRADVNRADDAGMTALHIAAYWGESAIVTLLLAQGADVNAQDDQGMTPLHAAAVAGGMRARGTILNELKAKGGDDALVDRHGWCARDYMALWEDNPQAAEKLRAYLKSNAPMFKSAPPPKPN